MRQRACVAVVAGLVGLSAVVAPGSAWAQSKATAVLNVEVEDDSLTATLTSILRNEAQQLQGYQVVNKAAINLSEIVVVLGCEASSVQCLSQAAQQMNASTLIYGSLVKDGADWRLKVEVFDAEKLQITYRLQTRILGKDDLIVSYRREIEQFIKSIREQKDAPKLVISSNVRGAKVKINGEPVGTTPFEREGLKVGVVELEVSAEGFTTWSASIELAPGAEVKLNAPLKPVPRDEPRDPVVKADGKKGDGGQVVVKKGGGGLPERPQTPGEQMSSANWGAWTLIGVGGASLLGSGVAALLIGGVEDEIAQKDRDGTLTRTEYDALVDRGQGYETAHRVMLVVGLGAVSAGGIWLLVDKLSAPDDAQGQAAPRWDVRVGPRQVEALWRF